MLCTEVLALCGVAELPVCNTCAKEEGRTTRRLACACTWKRGTVKMDEEMAFNQVEDVFVSHVEDGVTFWAQSIERNHEISQLTSELARICPAMNSVFGNPDLCKIYGGLFSEDRCWYRCRLQQVISDETCMVTYIDYGNSENLNRSNIVELPESLQLPSIAKKYRLWGLQLSSNMELSQFDKAKQFLSSLIFEKQIRVRHKVTYKDNTVVVQAEFGNTDIAEEVAKKGFAERCKSIANINYNGDRKVDGPVCPPKNSKLPSPVWKNRYVENIPVAEQQNMPLINRQRGCFGNQRSSEMKCERNALLTKERLVSSEYLNMVKTNQDQKMMEEEEKLKAERDAALQNCKALESQIEQLNFDFQKRTLASEERIQNLERSLESSVRNKLRELSTKIELLRTVRHGHANMNIRFGDNLSEAVRIVTVECLAVPSSLHKLDESWTEYKLAQERIRLCKDVGEVDAAITKRNLIQKSLYSVVEEFIVEVENVPLSNRTATLQALSRSLATAYGQVIEAEDTENILDEFHEWKCSKMEEFQRVRKETDDSLEELLLWFCHIKKSFDLAFEVSLDSEDVVGDIDGLLANVKSFLDKELAISLVDQDDMDKKIILNAYSNVIKKIQEEEQLIKVVELKYRASVEFKKKIMEWLKSPNIDHLLSIKKTIKSLKAQLRWRLVEKNNMEELDEYSDTDMKKIKEEIVELRNKIFQEIILEQEEYEKLSNLVQKWFPELPLLHPEAGILKYMASGGLLSMSLERDLLDGEPMKELSNKRPLVCSEVQGQKVLLKGYSVGVDTETTVIVKAAEYHKAWSELKEESGLLPLMFLFFCKSDPLAYLMVPFYPGENLAAVQASEPLILAEVIKVMKGIACGLQTLHKSNLVHGAIHPNNTFAVYRKKGIVGDFDFTKTADQRSSANSFGNLILAAPELKMEQPASPSTDMYAYGCLLLWLCTGNDTFKMNPDGTPKMDGLDLDMTVKSLISGLICPGDRMMAMHVLANDCFYTPEVMSVLSPTTVPIEDTAAKCDCAAIEMEGSEEKVNSEESDLY